MPWLVVFPALAFLLMAASRATASTASTSKGELSYFNPQSLYESYGAQYGVPVKWMRAFAIVESNEGKAPSVARGLAYPNDVEGSKSSDGKSWGLFQLTLRTAKGLTGRAVTPQELNDPAFSARLGAMLLQEHIDRYGLNLEAVARAYNGGPDANDPNDPDYATTTPYVAKIKKALSSIS